MGALSDDQERRKRRRTEIREAAGASDSPERRRCHVHKLPPEILQRILSYLRVEEQLVAHQGEYQRSRKCLHLLQRILMVGHFLQRRHAA